MHKIKLLLATLVALLTFSTQAAEVTISWNASPASEQATYILEYRVNGINPWVVAADNLTTNSFTTNFTSGVFREFRYAAKNLSGQSAYSPTGSQDPAPPASATAPTVSVDGNDVTIDWAPISTASTYVLEYRVYLTGGWTVLIDDTTDTSFTQAFTPGTRYEFRVAGKNITGQGVYGPSGSTPPVPSTPSTAPIVSVN